MNHPFYVGFEEAIEFENGTCSGTFGFRRVPVAEVSTLFQIVNMVPKATNVSKLAASPQAARCRGWSAATGLMRW